MANGIGLKDHGGWTRLGGQLGRQNLPQRPGDDVAPRAQLKALLIDEARAAYDSYRERVDALDRQRYDVAFRLDQLRRCASDDPRSAMVEPLARQQQLVEAQRAALFEQLITTMDELQDRALAADAAWRTSNQQNRDRRIVIQPTSLTVPARLRGEIPDPLR